MSGVALTLTEREEIARLLILDPLITWAGIAREIDRHPTTIAREVTRHGGRHQYRPAVAERCAARSRRRPRQRLGRLCGSLRTRIRNELLDGRSPEAIWADLKAENVVGAPCVETIYQAVYAGTLGVKPTQCLRTRRYRRRVRQSRHVNNRQALPNIASRPNRVNNRLEPGHWEADQIIGANNKSSMLWLTERVTRFSIPVTMPDGYNAEATLAGLVEGIEQIPQHLMKSITFDQGPEWSQWPTLALTYRIDCWFCDPHSPWQRGQIGTSRIRGGGDGGE